MTYTKEHKDDARLHNLVLFKIELDHRHIPKTVDPRGGFKKQEWGAMSRDKATRILATLREEDK
jgi:hypothetical protein